MTAYLITLAEPTSPVNVATVHRYESRGRAEDARVSGQLIICGEEDITQRGASLVDLYNAVTESGLKRFESNELGVKRIFAVLPQIAKELPMTDETNTPTETVDPKEAKRLAKIAKDNAATEAKAAKKAKREAAKAAKPARKPREVKLGAFAPVRESSALGAVLKSLIAGEPVTVDDKVLGLLKRARVTHGFDHRVADDGSVELVLPEGKVAGDLIKASKSKAERKSSDTPKHIDRIAKEFAQATEGVMPVKPTVTSATNMHRQKHFDRLCAHAEAGEWDKVSAYQMKGTDTYAKMIHRYRDQLLAAHDAQMRQAAE